MLVYYSQQELYSFVEVKHKYISLSILILLSLLHDIIIGLYTVGITGERKYGHLAPIGGVCFILGWIFLAWRL